MKPRLSARVNIIGLILMALMVRASFWQWERYNWKLGYIARLEQNLARPVVPLTELVNPKSKLTDSLHRRVAVEGEYDFEYEMVLRNREYEENPGVLILTPLKLKDSDLHILVNRGFIPFADAAKEKRIKYRRASTVSFQGLIKETMQRKMFSPTDAETGEGHTWVDSWLRVDLPKIAKQLPYPILPVYLEVMGDAAASTSKVSSEIVQSTAGKDELFFLPARAKMGETAKHAESDYPIPVYNTVIPPGRHLGYVYEWAAMALMTALICIAIQLNPRRGKLS